MQLNLIHSEEFVQAIQSLTTTALPGVTIEARGTLQSRKISWPSKERKFILCVALLTEPCWTGVCHRIVSKVLPATASPSLITVVFSIKMVSVTVTRRRRYSWQA